MMRSADDFKSCFFEMDGIMYVPFSAEIARITKSVKNAYAYVVRYINFDDNDMIKSQLLYSKCRKREDEYTKTYNVSKIFTGRMLFISVGNFVNVLENIPHQYIKTDFVKLIPDFVKFMQKNMSNEDEAKSAKTLAKAIMQTHTLEFRQKVFNDYVVSKHFENFMAPYYTKIRAAAQEKIRVHVEETVSKKRKEIEDEIRSEIVASEELKNKAVERARERLVIVLEPVIPKFKIPLPVPKKRKY